MDSRPRVIFVLAFCLTICIAFAALPAWGIMLLLGAAGWQWSYLLTLTIVSLVPACALRFSITS